MQRRKGEMDREWKGRSKKREKPDRKRLDGKSKGRERARNETRLQTCKCSDVTSPAVQ